MNYNDRTPITVNIVDFATNIVYGRYPCNDYQICTEYLSNEASTFVVTDLCDETIIDKKRKSTFRADKTFTYAKSTINTGDYVYVTKNDGSDIVPRRASAFYVGIITNIDGYTITTKSILTLLDMDSVVGLKGMFPALDWNSFPGYTTTNRRPWTDYEGYALFDCDTILSLIQSIEYALGQTPKLETWPVASFGLAQYEKKFVAPMNTLKLKDIDWAGSSSTIRGHSGYLRPYQYNNSAVGYNSPWWASAEKADILIDCPARLLSMGRGDPQYFFDILSYSTWYSEVIQWGDGSYYSNTIRKSMRPEDFPACYCGLGNNANTMKVESLWSRLKKWYDEKHIMVIPVVYDSAELSYSPYNDIIGISPASEENYQHAILVSDKGAKLSTEKPIKNMSTYDLYDKYNPDNYMYAYNSYWYTYRKSTSAKGTGFLWNNLYIGKEYDGSKPIRTQNDFYEDNVYRNTSNGGSVLHYKGSANSDIPIQYAHMGFKIIHIDSDQAYKHSGEIYRFDNSVIVGGSVDTKYVNKLYNFTPMDPMTILAKRNQSISTAQRCLPRGGYKSDNYGADPYSFFYNYSTGWNWTPNTNEADILGDLYYCSKILRPTNELSWFLDLDENDPNIEFAIQNGNGRIRYDVLLYKSTIGAISQKYGDDDEEWPFYDFYSGINKTNSEMLLKPYPNALPVDDEEPVAQMRHTNKTNDNSDLAFTILRGGFDPINGIANGSGGTFWTTGGYESRRKSQHKPVGAPVLPMVDTLSNLKALGSNINMSVSQYLKNKLPVPDSEINFDIKIYNSIGSDKVNKWQIRPGQTVFLRLKNGQTYTNLRVLGVNINKDDDFFTVSVGAKSPTLLNEIERRTR